MSTSDAELLLLVESQKKSGLLAAALNFILPGAGYAYCGRWILGIVVFIFVVTLVTSFSADAILNDLVGSVILILWAIMIVDGFLSAYRYNKKMISKILLSRHMENSAASTR